MNKFVLSLLAAFCFSSFSFAADKAKEPAKEMPALTKEQRADMAKHHQKMAECLKSDKPMSECKKDMHEGCKEKNCPMMAHKGGKKCCAEEGSCEHDKGHKHGGDHDHHDHKKEETSKH